MSFVWVATLFILMNLAVWGLVRLAVELQDMGIKGLGKEAAEIQSVNQGVFQPE